MGWMWSVLRIVGVVVVIYLVIGIVILVRQSSYVYHPARGPVGLTPEYFDISYSNITITTEDGESIAAWHVPGSVGGPLNGRTLLFCHGNAGNIGDRLDSINTFHKMGLDVLLFDYRGYGDSTGFPSEWGTYLDAKAAWLYLAGKLAIPPNNIIVFGRSLGGSVALWMAKEFAPGAVICESTFTSAPDMAAAMFPFLPVRYLCRYKYDSLSYIRALSCPVLVAHSVDDETVPIEHGRRLFNAAREPKLFVEMRGGHNSGGLDGDQEYQRKFVEFVAKHVLITKQVN